MDNITMKKMRTFNQTKRKERNEKRKKEKDYVYEKELKEKNSMKK